MDTTDLAARIVAGERRALARGITLVESTREDQNTKAAEILASLPIWKLMRYML